MKDIVQDEVREKFKLKKKIFYFDIPIFYQTIQTILFFGR